MCRADDHQGNRGDSPQHRVLIVGVGSIGERHLRCFLKFDRTEVFFVDANSALAAEIAHRYPSARRIESIDAAIEAGASCAVVATPAPTHVPLAIKLVDERLHVLIEKPLSGSLNGIDELASRVANGRRMVAVGYVYRAHPALGDMRKAIVSGRFGKALEIVCVSGQHFPKYRPGYAQTYYASRASGGGAIQDALTHFLDAGQWLVGPITRLVADASHQALENVEVEDTIHLLAQHGRVAGSYSLNQHQAANEATISVICESGIARFEYHLSRWRYMEKPDSPWIDFPTGPLERDELFVRQANAFLDAIERKTPALCALDEGIMDLRCNLSILESIERNGWVDVAQPQGIMRR